MPDLPELRALPTRSGPDSASSPPDGAHLDAIPLEDDGQADGQAPPAPEPAESLLSREQFAAGFAAAFAIAGQATGLRTLSEAPQQPTMPGAASALYDIALESPWLRWLISPQSLWLQRAIALGAFAVPLAGGVAAELRDRQRPRQAEMPA